jgi:hypothetical protein
MKRPSMLSAAILTPASFLICVAAAAGENSRVLSMSPPTRKLPQNGCNVRVGDHTGAVAVELAHERPLIDCEGGPSTAHHTSYPPRETALRSGG